MPCVRTLCSRPCRGRLPRLISESVSWPMSWCLKVDVKLIKAFLLVSALLESTPEPRAFPKPLTPQYYLSAMAKPEEMEVLVTEKDFIGALEELIPSVSLDDIQHYESVRRKFASETLNSEAKVNGDVNGDVKKKDKGKGKARA